MRDLLIHVLKKRDLSKARDLFYLRNEAIADELNEAIRSICDIVSIADYVNNENDQSVVEICITRVVSAIRETDSFEEHAEMMITLLEACLNHNLKPSFENGEGGDPPHAKVASDVINCIFMNYNKKEVMKRVLPVAVKFLHKGNREISRSMASYLALAAVHHAQFLSKHVQLIIDSIISGNYPLCRVLPQIYDETKEQIHDHVMALVSLLPSCDLPDKLALLDLFAEIANNMPTLLEASLPQLREYLSSPSTSALTMQVFLNLANKCPHMLLDSIPKIMNVCDSQPSTMCLTAQVLAAIGKLSKERAQVALNFILEKSSQSDRLVQGILMKEASQLCSAYPVLFTEKMSSEIWNRSRNRNDHEMALNGTISHVERNSPINQQTLNGVTIVKVNGDAIDGKRTPAPVPSIGNNRPFSAILPLGNQTNIVHFDESFSSDIKRKDIHRVVMTPRLKLICDSRSTGRLHTANNQRVNNSKIASLVGGAHKSMTKLSSNQLNTPAQLHQYQQVTQATSYGQGYYLQSPGCVTVTTREHSPTKSIFGSAGALREDGVIRHSIPNYNSIQSSHDSSNNHITQNESFGVIEDKYFIKRVRNLLNYSPLNHSTTLPSVGHSISDSLEATENPMSSMSVIPRRNNNNSSVTIINNDNKSSTLLDSHRISVFEPYQMRDIIQHFCEKHLEGIKSYMDRLSTHIPIPVKCIVEERRAKKMMKIHFACQGRGEHCLYNRSFFTMRTRYPRIWIHLMFLRLQSQSTSALSSRHPSVMSQKNCWDILKCENRAFVTLVTSSFPCVKDQELLLNELRRSGFFDVYECNPNGNTWNCFLCSHPERAVGFLQNSQPVIEGQLKEKKGKWKLFKRWKTRYFTLSGAHLSYKESKDDKSVTPIDVYQIRSVKVCRGARNIPKAFEIFTGDRSLILKPKRGKNVEEWVQCLSIVVAHSQAKELPSRNSSLIRHLV